MDTQIFNHQQFGDEKNEKREKLTCVGPSEERKLPLMSPLPLVDMHFLEDILAQKL